MVNSSNANVMVVEVCLQFLVIQVENSPKLMQSCPYENIYSKESEKVFPPVHWDVFENDFSLHMAAALTVFVMFDFPSEDPESVLCDFHTQLAKWAITYQAQHPINIMTPPTVKLVEINYYSLETATDTQNPSGLNCVFAGSH